MSLYFLYYGSALIGLLMQNDWHKAETLKEAGQRLARALVMAMYDKNAVGSWLGHGGCGLLGVIHLGLGRCELDFFFDCPDSLPEKSERRDLALAKMASRFRRLVAVTAVPRAGH